ncbi:MAG: hypothetical protein Q7S14_02685 [bacterium]|nr:hypothetical protein [bacterium]
MNTLVRTTISFPDDLYDLLRFTALRQKRSVSDLVNESIQGTLKSQKVLPGEGIDKFLSLSAKLKIKKIYNFNRGEFYDKQLKHKMSFGY